MSQLIDQINAQLAALKLQPLNEEQLECLRDRSRLDEAAGMLEDLHSRCGVRVPVPTGKDLGFVFNDADEARAEAAQHAREVDALCIEEMATDESRSWGGNEYRLLAFSGPDGAFAALSNPASVACWVAGQEQQ